jgi:hypothetical protein
MSFHAKRELLVQVAPRYRTARHGQRSAILDEFVAVTGYERKYVIRLLLGPIGPPESIRRPRAAYYGVEVQQAPAGAWTAANGICGKRLVPFLPELIPTLERHRHLELTDGVREQLLTLSAATADRLLAPLRQPHGVTTTKPGRLLKKQIPVRTFTEWTDGKPAFWRSTWSPTVAAAPTGRSCTVVIRLEHLALDNREANFDQANANAID